MSKHSTDWLALLIGLLVLALGLGDLADTAGLLSAGTWVLVPVLLITGAVGLGWSLRSIRARPETSPPDPE